MGEEIFLVGRLKSYPKLGGVDGSIPFRSGLLAVQVCSFRKKVKVPNSLSGRVQVRILTSGLFKVCCGRLMEGHGLFEPGCHIESGSQHHSGEYL